VTTLARVRGLTFRKREVTDDDVLDVLERVMGMVKGAHKHE